MHLSEGIPFKTCANLQVRDQNIHRANAYENEMVLLTYRDLNRSGHLLLCEATTDSNR